MVIVLEIIEYRVTLASLTFQRPPSLALTTPTKIETDDDDGDDANTILGVGGFLLFL